MNGMLFAGISVVAIVVFVGLDLRSPGFRRGLFTDAFLRRRNFGYVVANVVTIGVLGQVNAFLSRTLPALIDWSNLPFLVEVLACVVVAEGINWFSHWIKHVRPWLWTFHLQHHVGRHYDTTLTLHTHGIDVVVSGALMSAALLLMGFSRFSVDVFVLLYFVANLYKHHHLPMSLGPVLDRIIVGPAYHRVHHHRQARGNYGSVLTVFDVLLGTAIWPTPRVWSEPVGVAGMPERSCGAELLAPLTDLRTPPRAEAPEVGDDATSADG